MTDIKEALLHYIWKTKNFDLNDLVTTSGQLLTILDFGQHNHDAGPDFLHAKVKLDDVIWCGHIEIHIKSSDWLNHHHDRDPNYENVILHVVLEDDQIIRLVDRTKIPCLELKSRIQSKMVNKYYKLSHTAAWIPCHELINSVSPITKVSSLDKMNADRLTTRSAEIINELKVLKGDIQTVIYRRLAKAWGFKVNGTAMYRLARLLPLRLLHKHKDNLNYLEALFFWNCRASA